jgi:nucleoside-diphosphate-sugar epimerase
MYEMLIKDDLQSGIYNFADDEALSTNELISTINKALNKKPKLWSISKV